MDLKWSGPPENSEKWSRVLTKISYASSVQKKALTGSLQPQHHRIGMDVLKHSSRRVKVLSKGPLGARFSAIRIVHVSA